jgi:hypothetical protein
MNYYCRKGVNSEGDLAEIEMLDGLLGKICDTSDLHVVKSNYYGPCH